MQGEVQGCVAELDKLKKIYVDDEHVSHDARDKAREAEEKYIHFKLISSSIKPESEIARKLIHDLSY